VLSGEAPIPIVIGTVVVVIV